MNNQDLRTEYANIEKRMYPIMDYLELNKSKETIKNFYKGFITLQSPLLLNPEILFLGINPGQGAFNENKYHGVNETIRIFEPDKPIKLDWYKNGNARCRKKSGKWAEGYEWFERNQGINNQFVANMIELLYEVAKLKYPNENIVSNTRPSWFETFGQKVMFTNLYPIATKNIKDLNAILKTFSKEPNLIPLFGKSNPIRKWDVQRYFIRMIEDLVKLIEPKVIVCLGTHAFNDFTFTTTRKNCKVFKSKKDHYPVIGFNRTGNWSNLIPKIAKTINNELE